MKVSIMLGSLRKDSYHRKLFELYKNFAAGELIFSEIPTSDFPLYDGDLEANKPEIIETHANTIRGSDGLMFFSPEYNYSIPGHLKNAIDWLSRVKEQPFNQKKATIVGGSPGGIATARMQYELRKIGVYLNINFLNKPEVLIGSMFTKFSETGELTDQATIAHLRQHLDAFKAFLA